MPYPHRHQFGLLFAEHVVGIGPCESQVHKLVVIATLCWVYSSRQLPTCSIEHGSVGALLFRDIVDSCRRIQAPLSARSAM